MSIVNLEPAMAALFKRAQAVNTPATPFKVMSRRMRHFTDVKPEEIPALFQFQAPGFTIEKAQRSLPVFRYRVWWMVYLPVSQNLGNPTSPQMNNYVTALTQALTPSVAEPRITLRGLVYECYLDGQGLMDEGLLTTPSLIALPITILHGM